MGRVTDDRGRFVVTLKIRYDRSIQKHLDKMFSIANNFYNNVVADSRARADKLRATDEWQENQAEIKRIYKEWYDRCGSDLSEKEVAERAKELKSYQTRQDELIAEWNLRKYDIPKNAAKYKLQFGYLAGGKKEIIKTPVLNSQACNHICEEVWTKVNACLKGKGKSISFRKASKCRSIRFPAPQGCVLDGDYLRLTVKGAPSKKSKATKAKKSASEKRNKALLAEGKGNPHHGEFMIPIEWDHSDYECQALANVQEDLCYCTLVRIPWKRGWLYKVQLTLKGEPPVLIDENACLKHHLGKGRVGIDINMRQVAVVTEKEILFQELAPSVYRLQNALAKVQQKMDQSQRISNPEMYNEKKELIHGDVLAKLHPECVKVIPKDDGTNKYVRLWKRSNNWKKLRDRERYLYAKATRIRKCQHQELANKIAAMGDEFYIEPMDWKEMQKKAEYQEPEPGEKHKSRKRHGKSIGEKSPASFVNILREKIEAKGGTLTEINTYFCKASQYNHVTKTCKKADASVRKRVKWDIGGHMIQRDLYSAFLICNVNDTLDGYNQDDLEKQFDNFVRMHDQVMNSLPEHVPSSMGKKSWLQQQ